MGLGARIAILGLRRGAVAGDRLRVGGLVELQVLRVVGLRLWLGVVLVGHGGLVLVGCFSVCNLWVGKNAASLLDKSRDVFAQRSDWGRTIS